MSTIRFVHFFHVGGTTVKEILFNLLYVLIMLYFAYAGALDIMRTPTVPHALMTIVFTLAVSPGIYLQLRNLFFPSRPQSS